MTSRAKLIVVFAAGFIIGALFAATAVSWKWLRDFEHFQAMGLSGQAFTATEIYAGRSEELADRILDALPGDLAAMDRQHPDTISIRQVVGFVGSTYRESGETMPDDVREILDRWATTAN